MRSRRGAWARYAAAAMPPSPAALPTSLVGSYAQPDWLIDRARLRDRFPPRVRAQELWRIDPRYLEEAQDDATVIAIRDQERPGWTSSPTARCAARATPTASPPRSTASTSTTRAPPSTAPATPTRCRASSADPPQACRSGARRGVPARTHRPADQDHRARPVHDVPAGAERLLRRATTALAMDYAAAVNEEITRSVRRRRRRRPDRRALHAGAARAGARIRPRRARPRARRRHRHHRRAHLLRLRRDHPRAAVGIFVPARARRLRVRADLDRDRAVEPRSARCWTRCRARRSCSACIDLVDHEVETPEAVAERIRRALPARAARADHRRARLRDEVPAARGRVRQARVAGGRRARRPRRAARRRRRSIRQARHLRVPSDSPGVADRRSPCGATSAPCRRSPRSSGTAGSCRSAPRAGRARGSPPSPAAATRRPPARARRRRSGARRRSAASGTRWTRRRRACTWRSSAPPTRGAVALNSRLDCAHRRGLRIGVGDARDGLVVGRMLLAGDVRGDDVALVLADVGQRPDAGDISDRPQALARAQVLVDVDPVGVGLDADASPGRSPRRADAARWPRAAGRRAARVPPSNSSTNSSPSRRAAVACVPSTARCRPGAAPRRAPRPAARARAASTRSAPSTITTSPPRRRTACASSTPAGPPPSTSSRRGTASMLGRLTRCPRRRRARAVRDRRHERVGAVGQRRRARRCGARRRPRPLRCPASRPVPRSRSIPDRPASAPGRRRSSRRP